MASNPLFGRVPWTRITTPDPLEGWFDETEAIRAADKFVHEGGHQNTPLPLTFPTSDRGWDIEYTLPQEVIRVHVDGSGNPSRITE